MPDVQIDETLRTEERRVGESDESAVGEALSSGAAEKGEVRSARPLPIETLTIEGYRSIRKLEIKGLGRVNLLTGKNDTGKTSVLEALRILASGADEDTLDAIIRDREEGSVEAGENGLDYGDASVASLSCLFHGYPESPAESLPVRVSVTGALAPKSLGLEYGWDSNGSIARATTPLENLHRNASPRILRGSANILRPSVPKAGPARHPGSHVYLSASRAEGTGALWDAVELTDKEDEVAAALRIVDPSISSARIVRGGSDRAGRVAMVRSKRFPRPVPLRSFGDGASRLFHLALVMVSVKEGGLVLIDEFENGMHYSVQLDAWRMVFRIAGRLGVQVFATTHSWDAIETFQKAAEESPESGALIKLVRHLGETYAASFDEDDLGVIARGRIEAR